MVQFYRHFPITGPLSSADMADGCLISLKWCYLLPPLPHSFSRLMGSPGQFSSAMGSKNLNMFTLKNTF
jgi:hypothetical protein